MMITIREESELKEFVVTTNSEFARVGRKGIIFKLSTETLLLTFSSDQVLKVFCVDKCKLLTSWNFLKDSNNFSDSVVKIREDKSSSVFRWHRFWHRREKYFNQKYLISVREPRTPVPANTSNSTDIWANNRTWCRTSSEPQPIRKLFSTTLLTSMERLCWTLAQVRNA